MCNCWDRCPVFCSFCTNFLKNIDLTQRIREWFRFAVPSPHPARVRAAVPVGPRVARRCSPLAVTPRHPAASTGHTATCGLLLDRGAAVDARNKVCVSVSVGAGPVF